MRIGIDIRPLLEKETGGISTYTEKLLSHLFRIDNQNEYLLFYNSFRKKLPPSLKEKFSYPRVSLKPFSFPNKIFNTSLTFFRNPKIDQLIGGVDLFFIPNLIFLALSAKVKKVITIHDLSFLLYPQFYSLKGRLWHRVLNPQKLIQQFDQVIAVSENTRQDIINLFHLAPDKVKTIYSGIDLSDYQNYNSTLLEQIQKKYELPEKFILSLFALEPRKNIEAIVSAFELFKKRYPSPYHLVIAGANRGKTSKLHGLIQKSECQKDIHTLGYVLPEEKPLLFKLASVFVYPSFYEGFGFPPLEAMAASRPVIASHSSSLSEICETAAFLVDPYNIEELVAAFKQVLFNEQLSKNLIKKGLQQTQKFPWAMTAQNTLNLFESLVS